jgi:hypothetical protein
VLVGPPNNGKTAVIDRLLAVHPPSLNRWAERTHLPVLSLETPPTPLFRKLFKSALRKVGALVIPCDRKEAVKYLGAVLEAVGTRVIAVDQAQHILAGFPFQQEEFLSFLVETARRAQADLLLVGAAEVLELGPLFGEWDVMALPAWPLNDDFRSLVEKLEQSRFGGPCGKVTPHAPTLHRLCEGRLGELIAIFAAATRGRAEFDERVLARWIPPSERFARTLDVL